MAFTETFGGTTIYPSDVSYRAISLSANQTLAWPLEVATNSDVVAQIMDVTPSAGSFTITMPPANEVSPGETALFFNAGSFNFTVADNAGNTIVAITPGLAYQVYLTTNTTVAGTWRTTQFGAGTSSATAGSLVGAGIKAINTTLNQSMAVSSLSVNYTAGASDRSSAFLWTGGAGTITLPAASTVGNDWFFHIRNGGTGAISLATTGGELINGTATVDFNPGDSSIIVCDGSGYFTIGFGQAPEFLFDYVSIDLTGQPSPYTLSGANLNRIAYQFSGTLTANMQIIVPATIQQYWVGNFTTGGSYTVTVKTSAGTGTIVATNARSILYCDGTNVVNADTGGISIPILVSQGGTGATNASDARTNLGATSIGNALFIAVNDAAARNAITAAKSGANSDITSLTGLTTPLSVPQGGTGAATFTANGLIYGSGASALGVTVAGTTGQVLVGNTGTAPSWSTLSGIGVTSFSAGSTGLTPSTATTGVVTLAGTLIVANGGTGATTLTGYVKGSGTSAFTASATIPATDISSGAALTKTDDTNVTLTLGGSPTTALLAATSITAGWTGQLSVARGGTGASTLTANGVLYGSGTSAIAATAVGATGEVLVGNTGGAPSWAALTGIGVTSFSAGTTGLTPNTATTGAVTLAGTLGVANGGTGTATAFTAGSVVFAGASGVYSQDNANLFWDDTNNRLGIGTASPAVKLDVVGAGVFKLDGSGSTTPLILRNNNTASTQLVKLGFDSNGAVKASINAAVYGNDYMTFNVGSDTERMRITSAGDVGIGTATPARKLDVNGSIRLGDAQALEWGGTAYAIVGDNAGAMLFKTASSERMRITSAGDVGIGTTGPSSYGKLAVIGNIATSTDGGTVLTMRANAGATTVAAYNATGSSLSFNTNANGSGELERMRITSAGDVGIGTATPDIFGRFYTRTVGINSSGTSMLQINGTTYGGIDLGFNGTRTATMLAETGGFYLQTNTAAAMSLGTNGLERMRIDSSGNVGIGTSSPTSYTKLTVAGGLQVNGAIGSTASTAGGVISNESPITRAYIGDGSGFSWAFSSRSSSVTVDRVTIQDTGDVMIGTTTAIQKLTIGSGSSTSSGINLRTTKTDFTILPSNTDGGGVTIGVGWVTGGQGPMIFDVGAERMRIDGSGNVGIGTASPIAKLDVVGSGLVTKFGSSSALSAYTGWQYNSTTLGYVGNGSGVASGAGATDFAIGSTGARALVFGSNDTERMRIASDGRTLIGTSTSPTGTAVSLTLARAGDNGVNLAYNSGAGGGASLGTITGAGLAFYTYTGVVGSESYSERMRIDSSGNLLVGKSSLADEVTTDGAIFYKNASGGGMTAYVTNGGTGSALAVSTQADVGAVIFFRSGTQVGSISVTASATAYNTSSDYRLKEIDGPIANSGAYIDALNPVQGSWKADGSRFIGLLAHEVQEVSETSVATGVKDGEEMQAMDYSAPELIANLIAEIQSLRARVAQLEGN
jgi:hypothetical protein